MASRISEKIFSAALLLCGFAFALATRAQTTISTNIPGVSANNPCDYVFSFYKFAMMISGVLALGAIVYGGVTYTLAAGNPSGQSEGKEWVRGALLGMLLLVSAYLILNVINPNLTRCTLPTLTQLTAPTPPATTSGGSSGCNVATFSGSSYNGAPGSGASMQFTCVAGANCPGLTCNDTCKNFAGSNCTNNTTVSGGTCSPITSSGNACSVSSAQSACSAWDPTLASEVCSVESRGDPQAQSGSDICADGTSFSIGLWQINITNTPGVTSACKFSPTNDVYAGEVGVGCNGNFSRPNKTQGTCLQCGVNNKGQTYCSKWSCSFTGTAQDYITCMSDTVSRNNQLACTLYRQSGSFCPWQTTAQGCGISAPC